MAHDIVDVIKNLQTLTVNDSAFKILKDFERVLDELDIYVYKNWEDGELLAGPDVNRYTVTCKFLWPVDAMPDPEGGERLLDYGCNIKYQKTHMMVPRKVYKPSDFRPGTKKGKIDSHPIWVVSVEMPKKLMQDIYQGYVDKDSARLADLMKYDQPQEMTPEEIAPEAGLDAQVQQPEEQSPAA
jgi:hypothetical protein